MGANVGNILTLMDATWNMPLTIQENESANIQGSLVDMAGDPILLGGLSAFTLLIYNEADESIIVAETSILNTGRGTVDANGNFVIRLDGTDTALQDSTIAVQATENHIARLKWTWNDGVADRTGIQEIRHKIQNIA